MQSFDVDEVIELALKDSVSFESIQETLGLSEKEVVAIMRKELKRASFVRWRKRVYDKKTKHQKKYSGE